MNKIVRQLTLFIVVLVSLSVLVGCTGQSSPSEREDDSPSTITETEGGQETNGSTAGSKVAVITPYLAQPGTQFYLEGFEAAATDKEWDVNVIDTAGDVAAVISRIEDVVNQGVDAIVINVDPAQVAAGLEVAADAGVPVFGMDSGTDPLLVTNVTSNGYAMAAETATYVANRLDGAGRVVMFVFDPFPPVQIRGVVADAIFGNYPDIEIIDRITPAVDDGGIADSRAQMEAVLAANPEPGSIGAVWAAWDQPALGALQAIEAAGREDEGIVIVGIDANPQAIEAISSGGNFEASVAQDFVGIGSTTVDMVERQLAGEVIKEQVVYVPTSLVTLANASGGAAENSAADDTDTSGTSGANVAVITPYLAQPGTQFYLEGFEAAAAEQGWNVNVIDTAGDVAAVISRIEDVANQGVDAIVINVDPAQVAAGLEVAADAGIPVFGMDSGADPLLVTNVTSNGYAMAAETATYVANRLEGVGRVVMFVFDPFPPVQIRGVVADAIFGNYPDIEIIDRITPAVDDGGIADSRAQMEAVLAANLEPGSIGAVWAAWDQPALGALLAIEAAGREDEGIVIVGIDANPQAVDAISAGGNFEASVAQDFMGIGSTTVAMVTRYLNGETIKERVSYVPTELVTVGNVSAYMAEE
ncbi:MAG: substrate-binding domain-containing protein [Chloroflexota bacterium]